MTRPTQDVRSPKPLGQPFRGLHPVLEWQDCRLLADQRLHRVGGCVEIVRLGCDDHEVDGAHLGRVVGGLHARQVEASVDALDAQPFTLYRAQVLASGDEGHVLTRLREQPSEVSADAACSNDRNAHDSLLLKLPG